VAHPHLFCTQSFCTQRTQLGTQWFACVAIFVCWLCQIEYRMWHATACGEHMALPRRSPRRSVSHAILDVDHTLS